jgi:hypothetical protein
MKKTSVLKFFLLLLLLTGTFKLNTVHAGFGSEGACITAMCVGTGGKVKYCKEMFPGDWMCIVKGGPLDIAISTTDQTDQVAGVSDEAFSLEELSVNFFKIALPFAVIFGFINIISAGYMLMTSEGDPRRTNEGKEKLTAGIMGTLYVLLTIGILRIILGTLIAGTGVSF